MAQFPSLDMLERALDAALGQDRDPSRTPYSVSLWTGLAAGAQFVEDDTIDLIDGRTLVGPEAIDPATLGPTTLYGANDVTLAGPNVTSINDQSGNGIDANILSGGAPTYSASYAPFGGLPAILCTGGYLETVTAFSAEDVTIFVAFYDPGVTGFYEVIVDFDYISNFWLGRDVDDPNEWIVGLVEPSPPYGQVVIARDAAVHVIGFRRRGDQHDVFVDGQWRTTKTGDGSATGAATMKLGGGPSGGAFGGAIAGACYIEGAITNAQMRGVSQWFWENRLGQTTRLATAATFPLEQWGAIIGQPRDGLDDEAYLAFIRARMMANRSTGTRDELMETLATAFALPPENVSIHDFYPASYTMEAILPSLPSDAAVAAAGRLMEAARPLGIGDHVALAVAPYFGFDEDTRAGRTGFDAGYFAASV